MTCNVSRSSPVRGFVLGIWLLICSAFDDISVITAAESDPYEVPSLRCVYEDTQSWHWWYGVRFTDPALRNGTRCSYRCPFDAECRLGEKGVTVHHATDGGVFMREFHYPPLTKSLRFADGMLQTLNNDAFAELAGSVNLTCLHFNDMMLERLEPGAFSGLEELQGLDLSHNKLIKISSVMFEGLADLVILELSDNTINSIATYAFERLIQLRGLFLSGNHLSVIKSEMFEGLIRLLSLNLDNNTLNEISPVVFDRLSGSLEYLNLANNSLQYISADILQGLKRLERLFLNNNALKEIPLGAFEGLMNLFGLVLSNNHIIYLHVLTFQNQTRLEWLDLSHNRIRFLPDGLFQNLVVLNNLNLAGNRLSKLDSSNLFQKCIILKTLNLTQNDLMWITKDVFNDLNSSANVIVDYYATCCFVTSANCKYGLPGSEYLTCGRLLQYSFLRVGIWTVGLATLLGNIVVLYSRCRRNQQSNKVQLLLITNLSIADLFMGVYLMTLLSVDLYFKEYFPSHSESWRKSILCRTAGAVSILSSEVSVFLITLISIDRFLGIKYPFSRYRLCTKSARLVACTLWLLAFVISLTSFILGGTDSDIYPISEICVGLPISRNNFYETQVTSFRPSSTFSDTIETTEHGLIGSKVGMYFSIAIFTGLNLICFLIVGSCYLLIFIGVRQSAKRSARSIDSKEEIRMAMKMSLIVLTDFCCWVPLALLSILVQSGAVTVNPVSYAWIATFIVPLNSAINPFLYTLATKTSEYLSKMRRVERDIPDEPDEELNFKKISY